MVSNQRARNSEEKEARREQILEAALALWDQTSFAEFTMNTLAERLGLAKGTLYLYFKTKEELFLTLYERLLGGWFDDLEARLSEEGSWDAARVCEAFRDTLLAHPQLTRMLVLVESLLEHNISAERARAYKTWLFERASQSGALIEQRLPYLSAGEGVQVLVFVQALVAGLYPMSHPAKVVAEVLRAPKLSGLVVNFEGALSRGLEALLRGLKPRVMLGKER